MKNFSASLKSTLKRIHQDEQGAEGIEKVLIIAAIVLPLLAVLLYFKDKIVPWLKEQWESISGNSSADTTTDPF